MSQPREPRTGKVVQEGVLAGHTKIGRRYRPPLMTLPMTLSDWTRDDLPDLIWVALLVRELGDQGSTLVSRAQQAVVSALGDEADRVTFDGRLTSLESVPPELRPAILDALTPSAGDLFPEAIRVALSLYPELPGAWLLLEPWEPLEDPERAVGLLVESVAAAMGDPHVSALMKAPSLSWLIYRGRLHLPGEMADLLIDYPLNPDKVEMADAFIRSSFLTGRATAAVLGEETEPAAGWADHFWRTNWTNTACLIEQPMVPDEEANAESGALEDASADAVERTSERFRAFISAFMSEDIDLRDPERHEVVCGLATRSYRAVRALLRAPHLWTGDHSAYTLRLLFETEIYLKWLEAGGLEEFIRFKDYGLGKLKLMRRVSADFEDSLGDDAPEILTRLVDQLTEDTGGDWGDALQEVNLDTNFAGKNARTMAEELGEIEAYRILYQPTSGVVHGEWWVVSEYAMQRCMNPLHRLHEVPKVSEMPPMDGVSEMILGRFNDLMSLAEDLLRLETEEVLDRP